jgi:ribosome biogenesis protein UTP30
VCSTRHLPHLHLTHAFFVLISSVKIGTLTHTPTQILANLRTALPALAKRIPEGWDNLQSLSIKTSSSTSLPIWTCELGSDGRWSGVKVKEQADEKESVAEEEEVSPGVSADEEEDDDILSPPPSPPAKKAKKAKTAAVEAVPSSVSDKKGKKRAAVDPEDDGVQPAKKARAGDDGSKTKASRKAALTELPPSVPASSKKAGTAKAPVPESAAPTAVEGAPPPKKAKTKSRAPESSPAESKATAASAAADTSDKKATATDKAGLASKKAALLGSGKKEKVVSTGGKTRRSAKDALLGKRK